MLAPLAFLWALLVDRERAGRALGRVAPLLVITAAWALLHPRLFGRLWGPYVQTVEQKMNCSHRPAKARTSLCACCGR